MELLREMVQQEGSQKAAAEKLEVSQQFLNDVLNERRYISDAIARKLPPHGYRKVIFFERIFDADISELKEMK